MKLTITVHTCFSTEKLLQVCKLERIENLFHVLPCLHEVTQS